jgi:hypothetical protein|tara:strand:+ start:507 stop:1244 length:738 start_codon:yes stop_codon:yes gene_type:complete
MKKIQILKVKDDAEKYYTKKSQIFDIPFKIAIIGASQRSGKTNWIINGLGRDKLYGKDFEPENIYIFSPSLNSSKWKKFIEAKEVPEENLFSDLDEAVLETLYEDVEDEYNNAIDDKKRPANKIVIFDDLGFGGAMRGRSKFGIVDKLVMNGRHFNLSSAFLIQSYKQISPDVRGNLSGLVVFNLSTRELEAIINEHNYLENSKSFLRMFRATTKKKHSNFIINYSNDPEALYQDSNFMPVKAIE